MAALPTGRLLDAGGAVHDRDQVLLGRERHVELEEEPVELRLGQRIGALHLDRVLRGQHEERLRQRVLLLGDGDAVLLHRLEQRRLRLGRGAVDLVGQHEVAEDRSLLEAEAPLAALLHDDVRAEDVGRHQVGRELDAREVQVERLGQRAHQQRLAQAGHAFEQRVPAGDQADQRLPHELVLPDDVSRPPRSRCAVAISAKRSGASSSLLGAVVVVVGSVMGWCSLRGFQAREVVAHEVLQRDRHLLPIER